MVLIKIYLTKVGLVLNLFNSSISRLYHVVFDDKLSTVESSTAVDTEVWIRLVTSSKSSMQIMLDQENDPDMDNECLTND